MDKPYRLRLPGIDRLCSFILHHGPGCLIYKKDLQRAYRQFPVDPKDYNLLGFSFQGELYFDLRCPFGLRSSAMICQRTTSSVIHIFQQFGFIADVYLDDFFGAESPQKALEAFDTLQFLFDELGLQSSRDKDCYPSTNMICLGIEVDTVTFSLRVPQDRIDDLLEELKQWSSRSHYRKKTSTIASGASVFRHSMRSTWTNFLIAVIEQFTLISGQCTSQPDYARYALGSSLVVKVFAFVQQRFHHQARGMDL